MKPLPIAAAAGLGGLIALAALLPRLDPSRSAPLILDRGQAIERARLFAARYGVDTAGWRATLTDQTDGKLTRYRAAYPDDPAAALFGSLKLNVTLIEPGGGRRVRMVLFADGRPAQWSWDGPGGSAARRASGPAPDTILKDFAGSKPGAFVPNGVSDDGAERYDWSWRAAKPFPLLASLKMEQKAGMLRSISLTPVYSDEFEAQYKKTNSGGTPMLIARGVGALIWTVGLGLCIWQLFRGKLRWRIPLLLLAAQTIWVFFSFYGGTYYQEFVARKLSVLDALFFIAGENSNIFWAFFWLPVFAGAGSAIRSAGNREKWHTLDEISRGRILNRSVSHSLAVGMLSGIGLAALPYLVATIRWLPGNVMDFRSMDALVAPSVTIVALRISAAVPGLALFGFLFPFVRYLRKPVLFWAVFVPLGVVVLMDSAPFRAPAPALATAALVFGAYLLIYLRSDLLAIMAATIAARAAIVPALLLSQPLSSVRVSALGLVTVGAAAIAASVYWAVRGPEPDAAEVFAAGFSPGDEVPEKSDRERLQAEFQVARKAQEDALPADPPLLNGYSLAGWCEPAQQVGGDLYDFFPLPDGRLGVAVADVSGKGVPAALYMMVTKGLLVAVSKESNQLAYILEQINLHLYRACRKKVFVTMAAVVLDSSNRRLEYARAGHNPAVWRRASRGETTLVKPPGLGLGMTPGERFDRTLGIEQLELEALDAIVLYSDGVTEAVNHAMEQFGEERLMRAVERTDGQSASESRDAILRDLREFMGATPARDDITLVVIRA